MSKLKLGLHLDALSMPLRRGAQEAQRLGVAGVQVDAVGDLAPKVLSQSGRREFGHLLRAHGLELTALGCPLRHGLDVAEHQEQRIDHVKNVLTLSSDLGARIVVVPFGRIPDDPNSPVHALLSDALRALGQHGDRVGAVLALETGQNPSELTRQFLDRFDTGGLAVNLNPANMLLAGFDPYETTRGLHGKVAHAHAKDARKTAGARLAHIVPLGHGDIDWMQYLSVLEEIEYRGGLTITQEASANPVADAGAAVAFLRRLGV
jgi:sugar phosphate isomerase/epimerase